MCGIFGIITTKPTKLNKQAFNVLGIENDTRGGDSCGIFIDGNTEYGINDKKLYSKFFSESKLLNSVNKTTIALGHCRKASVGNISLETAQPVVLTNDDGVVEFVVMHNGTIQNYKELAEKYIPNVNITGLTDSQVIARIFYHTGYDVLEDYYGAAVFVIVDYRYDIPKVMFWKGKSKQYRYSPSAVDERPFYFVNDGHKFIFSSLSTYLKAFCKEEVYTINPNLLIELRNGDLYTVKEFDRIDNFQLGWNTEKYTLTTYSTYNGYSGYYSQSNKENSNSIITTNDLGLYMDGDIECHGSYIVDCQGNLYKTHKEDKTEKLYFWDGVLLYGASAFNFLKNTCNKYNLQVTDVKYVMGELLNYLSPYPITSSDYILVQNDNPKQQTYKGNKSGFIPFTGSIGRFLKGCTEHYSNGVRIGTSWTTSKEDNFKTLLTLNKCSKINYGELYKELYS